MSPSVEHGGKTFKESGAAPPVVIAMPDDEINVSADDKVKKDARLTKYAFNYFRFAQYSFFFIVLASIAVLAIRVSKGKSSCRKFIDAETNPHNPSRSGYDPEAQRRDAHCNSCSR